MNRVLSDCFEWEASVRKRRFEFQQIFAARGLTGKPSLNLALLIANARTGSRAKKIYARVQATGATGGIVPIPRCGFRCAFVSPFVLVFH